MSILKLTVRERGALQRIAQEYVERVGKRKTIPVGRDITAVVEEVALCQRLLTEVPVPDVEIGERKSVKDEPR